MKHARQSIREAVAAELAGITPVIVTNRVYSKMELPYTSVNIGRETSTDENDGLVGAAVRQSRHAELVIEITVEAADEVDDVLDDLAAQAESALAGDFSLRGTATYSQLTATTFTFSGSAEAPRAVARLQYDVWYRTLAADPESAI